MEIIDVNALLMIAVFCAGYFLITIESITEINKATVALLMAVICWGLQFARLPSNGEENLTLLGHHLADISQVIFFLLGALAVVEIINMHQGFKIISDNINIRSKRKLLWAVGAISFVLSGVLDNLTTTIVMISLLCKLIDRCEDRLLIGGGVVIAANAGGAWTPIGDVTTTMLWIGGQISTLEVMKQLFIPSLICSAVSLSILSMMVKGQFAPRDVNGENNNNEPMGNFVFFLGVGSLMFVPFLKLLTGLPPFMCILFSLAVMWLVTDILHRNYHDRHHLRMPHVLTRIDLTSILFFLGILLAIDALESAQILSQLAQWLDKAIGNIAVIATMIGIASAIVDNVPLVAATMGMYSMDTYPMDHQLWQLIAYCSGTGGSILIIGSAAGVVYMGLEKVDFFWYVKKISLAALVGYLAGIAVYVFL